MTVWPPTAGPNWAAVAVHMTEALASSCFVNAPYNVRTDLLRRSIREPIPQKKMPAGELYRASKEELSLHIYFVSEKEAVSERVALHKALSLRPGIL